MLGICKKICVLQTSSFSENDPYGCVSEKGDHMGWPDSETNYKFVVHPCEEIPVIS